jgi:helicase
MKRHYADLPPNEEDSSRNSPEKNTTLRGLSPVWKKIIKSFLPPSSNLTPAQRAALFDDRILNHQKNLIVASPTNSGKSLLGYLILLEAVRNGKCGLLLVPLKSLAREKADELRAVIPQIEKILKKKITVLLTTGDYRIEHEFFSAPPPSKNAEKQIIVATPERIEAVWRNPAYQNWFSALGAVCFDEAHLISDRQRGITMEYLITGLLNLPVPPRLVLLSASLGDTARPEKWLAPCATHRSARGV